MPKLLSPLLFRGNEISYKSLPKEKNLGYSFINFLNRLTKIKKLTNEYINFLSPLNLVNNNNNKLDKQRFNFSFLKTNEDFYYDSNDKIGRNYIKLIEIAKKLNYQDFLIENLNREDKTDLLKEISLFFTSCKDKEKLEIQKINEDLLSSTGISFSDYKGFYEINIFASKLRIDKEAEINLEEIHTNPKEDLPVALEVLKTSFSVEEKPKHRDKKIIKM